MCTFGPFSPASPNCCFLEFNLFEPPPSPAGGLLFLPPCSHDLATDSQSPSLSTTLSVWAPFVSLETSPLYSHSSWLLRLLGLQVLLSGRYSMGPSPSPCMSSSHVADLIVPPPCLLLPLVALDAVFFVPSVIHLQLILYFSAPTPSPPSPERMRPPHFFPFFFPHRPAPPNFSFMAIPPTTFLFPSLISRPLTEFSGRASLDYQRKVPGGPNKFFFPSLFTSY